MQILFYIFKKYQTLYKLIDYKQKKNYKAVNVNSPPRSLCNMHV